MSCDVGEVAERLESRTPAGDVLTVRRQAVCGHRSCTADDEFRSALCSVHSENLSQTALHSRRELE